MKEILKNKKGFTLIELLAVIVILAILVMVAIPAVTKYLDTARKGAFVDSVNTAVDAARNDYIIKGATGTIVYKLNVTNEDKSDIVEINDLLTKKMTTSPFGAAYSGTIKITGGETNNITTTTCFISGGYYIKSDDVGKVTFAKEDIVNSGTKCTLESTSKPS